MPYRPHECLILRVPRAYHGLNASSQYRLPLNRPKMTRKPHPIAPKSDAIRVRCDPLIIARINAEVQDSTVSDFVRLAIREKLDRLAGSSSQPALAVPPLDLTGALATLHSAIESSHESLRTCNADVAFAGQHIEMLSEGQANLAAAHDRTSLQVAAVAHVTALIARQLGLNIAMPTASRAANEPRNPSSTAAARG